MGFKWKNWAGNVVSNPNEILYPKNENEVVAIVQRAIKNELKIRVVGSGHSFSKVVATDHILVSLDEMQGVIESDSQNLTATVWGGTKLKKLGELLFDLEMAQENMGDIDVQSIAGALSTGTHGTGATLRTLSNQILEVTFVNGKGELVTVNKEADPALFDAIRVSIGTLGIFTRIKLQLEKAYVLEEITQKENLTDCLGRMEEYVRENRNFEFFWFPHTETVQTKFLNPSSKPFKKAGFGKKIGDLLIENWMFQIMSTWAKWFPAASKTVSKISAWGIANGNFVDWSHNIYATARSVKFYEMEYNVPVEHFQSVLLEIKEMITKDDVKVHFPVECRFVKSDDLMISPAYQREAAYIAVHQFKGMKHESYFSKAEAIFKKYGGRPHWGKMNNLNSSDFGSIYPRWEEFKTVRTQQDPQKIFLNNYLEKIF